ncbi:PACRG-like protein [Lineus longissimus]|uniref:PACRG-like protein n=1 Tax=Lineus longissimus TaxID=88925 RepID=UPI002B4C6878
MASRGTRTRNGSTGSGKSSAGSSRGSAGSSRVPAGGVQQKRPQPRPSDVLNPKTVDPFNAKEKNVTAFAAVYRNGGVPCRLIHGSVKHKLAWDTVPEQVPFDPVLVTLAEGLRETVHPYTFVARTGFKELLETPDSGVKAIPILPKLQHPIRLAMAHSDPSVFEGGLDALVQLSDAVGPALNTYLKNLLVSISKQMMNKKFTEKISDSLHRVEGNGGKECLPIIKSKIPTYSSIFA